MFDHMITTWLVEVGSNFFPTLSYSIPVILSVRIYTAMQVAIYNCFGLMRYQIQVCGMKILET